MKKYRYVKLSDNIWNKKYLLEIGELYLKNLGIIFYNINYLGLCRNIDEVYLNSFYYSLRITELKPKPFKRIQYVNHSIKPEELNKFIDKLNFNIELQKDLKYKDNNNKNKEKI